MKTMILLFLACIVWIPDLLLGDVQDYFKKINDKSGSHEMRNIDFIYMINLDERPEKFELSMSKLEPYGINPYRFSAVNGWNLTLDTINDLGVRYGPWMENGVWGTCYLLNLGGEPYDELVNTIGRTYFCHCMSQGAIGIILSHLSILQDAFDSGYNTIWVMEDDIEIIQDPRVLSDLIDKLDAIVGKKGWDILFTDQDTKNGQGEYVPCLSHAWRPNFTPTNPKDFSIREEISPDFKRVGARYGAYSMIIRRSGMKKLLQFVKKHQIFLPYDMDYTLPPGMHLFVLNDDVVSTFTKALSDNGKPNYKFEK